MNLMEVCSEGRERERNKKEGQKVLGRRKKEREKVKGDGGKGGQEERGGKVHVREERRKGEFWVFSSTMIDYNM